MYDEEGAEAVGCGSLAGTGGTVCLTGRLSAGDADDVTDDVRGSVAAWGAVAGSIGLGSAGAALDG